MISRLLALAALVMLAACDGSQGLADFDLDEAPPPPGISDLNVGVDNTGGCDFYGNCPDQSNAGGWW